MTNDIPDWGKQTAKKPLKMDALNWEWWIRDLDGDRWGTHQTIFNAHPISTECTPKSITPPRNPIRGGDEYNLFKFSVLGGGIDGRPDRAPSVMVGLRGGVSFKYNPS